MPTEREALRKALRENPEAAAILHHLVISGRIKTPDSLDPTEPLNVICGPDHGGITGSKQDKCGCGAVIWLSPSTQEMLTKRGQSPSKLLCPECAVRTMTDDAKDEKEQG
jgi:hypothetical protein